MSSDRKLLGASSDPSPAGEDATGRLVSVEEIGASLVGELGPTTFRNAETDAEA
jgi:hypothetical protein